MLLTKLNKLKNILNQNKLQFNLLKEEFNYINKIKIIDEYDYLNSLMYPEKYKGAKIPSQSPVPTSTFQWTARSLLQTSNRGTLLLSINPWFLRTSSSDVFALHYRPNWISGFQDMKVFITNISSILVCNTGDLTGTSGFTSITKFTPMNLGQTIPNIYSSYRLVSASLNIRYTGALEDCRGIIGGGIRLVDDNLVIGRYYRTNNMNAKYDPTQTTYNTACRLKEYGNFNLIRQLPYSYEGPLLGGLRMLYFPKDNSYEEFIPLFSEENVYAKQDAKRTNIAPEITLKDNSGRTGFMWMVYVQDAIPNYNGIVDMEITCNYEGIVKPEYLNFIDCSYGSSYSLVDQQRKKYIFDIVKENAIRNNKI